MQELAGVVLEWSPMANEWPSSSELGVQNSLSATRLLSERKFSDLHLMDIFYSAKMNVPNHSHKPAIFCIALTGACRESFAGRIREYNPLTLQFLPSYQSHSLDFSFSDIRAFSLNVNSYWLERAREYSLKLDNSIHSHGGLLTKLMMKIYREFRTKDDASRLAIEGLMLELLAETSHHQIKLTEKRSPHWLERATDLLREQFPERLTITDVANNVGVHPVHLAREFRRFKRRTIGEYVRELRVQHACRSLQKSEEPLAAIAVGAGFFDQSHFTRTFKNLMGLTPGEYRAMSRINPVSNG